MRELSNCARAARNQQRQETHFRVRIPLQEITAELREISEEHR